jgi:hypothetical protein
LDSRENSFIVNSTVEKIIAIEQGTPLSHLVLSEMLQTKAKTHKYYGLIAKLKTKLRTEYGLFLKNINRMGYEIALPGDEIHLCVGAVQKGVKAIVRGIKETSDINLEKITDNKKRAFTVQSAQKMSNLYGMLKMGGVIETKAIETTS